MKIEVQEWENPITAVYQQDEEYDTSWRGNYAYVKKGLHLKPKLKIFYVLSKKYEHFFLQ